MTTMRPFSRRCAIVSAPLPITSRYATVCRSSTRSDPIGPLGDRLTWPSAPSGAVATKNSGWALIQALSLSSMRSKVVPTPTGCTLRGGGGLTPPREAAAGLRGC